MLCRAPPSPPHPMFLLHPPKDGRWGWVGANHQQAPDLSALHRQQHQDDNPTLCSLKVTKGQVFAHCWSRGEKTCPALRLHCCKQPQHLSHHKEQELCFPRTNKHKTTLCWCIVTTLDQEEQCQIANAFLQNHRFFLRGLQPAELPAQI